MPFPANAASSSAAPRRRSSGWRSWLLVDGDVAWADARERLALEPAGAIAQAQAGDARHQVELRRPGVAELHGEGVDAVRAERVVLRAEALADDVVHVERDPAGVG